MSTSPVILSAGIVHVAVAQLISSQLASLASPEREAVRTRNSKAHRVTGFVVDSLTFLKVARTSA